MQENPNNLWPADLFSKKVNLPKNILIEQADYLAQMSKNLVVANVVSSAGVQSVGSKSINILVHEFVIKAPSLGNYQVPLFRIWHEDLGIYPVKVFYILEELNYVCENEESLKLTIGDILSQPKTKSAITYIISQV